MSLGTYIYDKNGNLVNVLEPGSSTDVIAHNYLSQTNKPLKVEANVETELKLHTVFPIIKNNTIFGYPLEPSAEDLDIYKITSVYPILNENSTKKIHRNINAERLPYSRTIVNNR